MNKYKVYTTAGRGQYLIYYGTDATEVKSQAIAEGHKVKRVVFVRAI